MDVVLINPNPGGLGLNEATIEPPLGLAYMASVLEKNDFKCLIIDANVLGLSKEQTLALIPPHAKLIGFYLNSFSYNTVKDLIMTIRMKMKGALTLIGGPLPSAADPSELLNEMKCDGLIRGEGEYSILSIMTNIRENRFHFDGEISGLSYVNTEYKTVSSQVLRIADLDEVPFPAFHLLPTFNTYKTRSRKGPVAAMMTSRGCAFDCTFCSKDIFQRRVTYRSAANVLAEIDYLVTQHGIRQIDILDDNFAQKKTRFIEILDGIIDRNYNLALNFQSGIRTEILDEDLFKKMKKAGVYKLAFGVESLDENVLRIHKKKLDIHKLEEAVRMAKKMNFLVYGFFIIGLLGETEDGFRKTLAFAKKVNFDVANFCMAIPFVNTELYRMVKDRGRFLIDTTRNIDLGFYAGKVFYEYDEVTEKDVLRRFNTAYKEFYTIKQKLKIMLSIRSLKELEWLGNAVYSVIKNKFLSAS